MPLGLGLRGTAEDVIALGVSQWGVRWPNPWASPYFGNSPSIDDCAMFVSWCLWGLPPDGDPYAWLVSEIQLRSGFEFHQGAAGIRRGDIVGWNWAGAEAGSYDHTGICTRVDGDIVYTLDANSGVGDNVGEYGRSSAYITSYVRPNYAGSSPADLGGATLINTQGDNDMPLLMRSKSYPSLTFIADKGMFACVNSDKYDAEDNADVGAMVLLGGMKMVDNLEDAQFLGILAGFKLTGDWPDVNSFYAVGTIKENAHLVLVPEWAQAKGGSGSTDVSKLATKSDIADSQKAIIAKIPTKLSV